MSASSTTSAISSTITTAIASATATQSASGFVPSKSGNLAFTVLFGIILISHIVLGIYFKQRWFGSTISIGILLEMVGYGSRVALANNPTSQDMFLSQITCLTVAPCFIMAAYYYLLGKLVIIYGPRFSMLPPIYYSYLFVTCDIIALVIQSFGGVVSSSAATTDTQQQQLGTHIMVGGLVFQVVSMTAYLVFWLFFFYSVYFRSSKETSRSFNVGITNFFHTNYKDELFNPDYSRMRSRQYFKYFPLTVTIGIFAVYVRCIYRVIELSEGWSGYLITHEAFVFVFDGAMVLIATYILLPPFYPGYVFGKNTVIVVPKSLKIKKQDTTQDINLQNYSYYNSQSKDMLVKN
ncbi:phospholipid-translocating ATPase [Saccharomycopsis crataegensis]|uniref:Sphingoid long-chain base transporter RSB1 n=1 Tax=Saccharomycopsis crataegensis TaxID=43959 RepID=A0AAV5QMX8_9ASCO|nr:phospholipid-translocating ATPase [Saccharomycopsis crataegensis]